VAVHITTGKFVWVSGPYLNVHDSQVFQNSGLASKYPVLKDGFASTRGLADKGYYSTNKNLATTQHLWTPEKKKKGEWVSNLDKKESQVISTVRIEVERAIGRLKQLAILRKIFRSSTKSLLDKAQLHNRIFTICIHFTNANMNLHPLRKKPHVLLCKGPIPAKTIKSILQDYMLSPEVPNLSDFLKSRIGTGLDEESDDSKMFGDEQ